MTFYEAALRVLESAGRPLHFLEITQKSIQEDLLSHVGKTPEQTMLSRLAAMARRPRDRKVVVTAKDTFALADWSLPEDAEALAQTGVPEVNPEEALPPLRPIERHPEPRNENVRASGRGDRKRRRDEEEEGRGGKRRRYPPIPEVVFEILSEAGEGLKPDDIAARARSRELASDELGTEQILTALLEDNQRRIDAGRRPQYVLDQATGQVSLERAGAPSEAPPLELQAAFAAALGIPLERGRPMLPRLAARGGEVTEDATVLQTARAAAKDARRAMARVLRRRLSELDIFTFEKSVVRMMQGLGFRELKVAKRSKDGPLLTTRKREGSIELRYAVRISRSPSVDRKAVQELRRDLGHYAAQVGLLVSAGEVRGDARGDAQSSGALVMLWCGEALAEKFFEAKTAVTVQQIEVFEIDDQFFEQARVDGEEARARREERKSERQGRERHAEEGGLDEDEAASAPRPSAPAPRAASPAPAAQAPSRPGKTITAEWASSEVVVSHREQAEPHAEGVTLAEAGDEGGNGADDEFDDGPEDGDDELEAATEFAGDRPAEGAGPAGAPQSGERKRRRRRRRGRRGRGARPGEPGAPIAAAGGAPGAEAAAAPAAPPPPPPESAGGGEEP